MRNLERRNQGEGVLYNLPHASPADDDGCSFINDIPNGGDAAFCIDSDYSDRRGNHALNMFYLLGYMFVRNNSADKRMDWHDDTWRIRKGSTAFGGVHFMIYKLFRVVSQ